MTDHSVPFAVVAVSFVGILVIAGHRRRTGRATPRQLMQDSQLESMQISHRESMQKSHRESMQKSHRESVNDSSSVRDSPTLDQLLGEPILEGRGERTHSVIGGDKTETRAERTHSMIGGDCAAEQQPESEADIAGNRARRHSDFAVAQQLT